MTRKVLITGSTGYIGRRLKDLLLHRSDLDLRLLVRNKSKVRGSVLQKVTVVEGDTFNQASLLEALQGIDTAYYLIHSMGSDSDFEERDRVSAGNFRDACIEAGVKRVIYLGGLGVKETASAHLLSRIETGEILSARPDLLQTIWFRAGIIIGSGSASFEIVRNLVQKLPMMITPKWVNTRTQPIAINDVLDYLADAIDIALTGDLIVDIGTETITFRGMMKATAKVMKLKRVLFPVPVLSPKLSSYWLILFTPVPFQMARALVEGLKSETVVLNDHARTYFPRITPMTFEASIQSALEEMEHHHVLSRWSDSSAGDVTDLRNQDGISNAIYRHRRVFSLDGLPRERIFRSICSLGGETGWFVLNRLWQIRGLIDKLAGGYGLNRGRRDSRHLRVGDALDFWKVADLQENRRLLLVAQMKLPGKAWLEFDIQPDQLIQTAHFHPRGILGRLYWITMLPVHQIIFGKLGKRIIRYAAELPPVTD
ncbi:SDR family oxidoreductase [bacterium]|nr:SDR family oxidoreductase [bacterium]